MPKVRYEPTSDEGFRRLIETIRNCSSRIMEDRSYVGARDTLAANLAFEIGLTSLDMLKLNVGDIEFRYEAPNLSLFLDLRHTKVIAPPGDYPLLPFAAEALKDYEKRLEEFKRLMGTNNNALLVSENGERMANQEELTRRFSFYATRSPPRNVRIVNLRSAYFERHKD